MLGIIGGSGIYSLDGLENVEWKTVKSPWGEPSDQIMHCTFEDIPLVFMPRHGRGHSVAPAKINYRANIDALKRAGVTDILSISACGSFREELSPGTFVIVDQYIDRTIAREKTFFSESIVAHVSLANPVCGRTGDIIEAGLRKTGVPYTRGGTYLCMEGPQFSTLAESKMYRTWGCDVIGMTNMPEAKLAREAEVCYSTVAMVTDYDCWHHEIAPVDIDSIIKTFKENSDNARELVKQIIHPLSERPEVCPKGCDRSLDGAILSSKEAVNLNRENEKLSAVAGRILKG